MATTPIIQSTGSVSGAGTPGQGRKDLDIGETVTLSDTEAANSGASYVWTFLDIPIGSSSVLIGPTTATPTFIPDVTGSYNVQAVVNGLYTSEEVLAVPLPITGARIPSFEERLEYDGGGNTKGWHEAMTEFMRQADSLLGTTSTTDLFSPPEMWAQTDIPAGQSSTMLTTGVSQLFNDFQVIRAGSIVGINLRFNGNLTGGSATATVAVNGSPGTLATTVNSGSSSGRNTQGTGIDVVSPGDTVSIFLSTTGGFGPTTLDAEAALEIQRSGAGTADIYSLPEVWTQNDVPASQAATPLFSNTSQLYDDIQVVRAGSIVGLNVRFTGNLTAGSATATVTINGIPATLSVIVSSGSSSGRSIQVAGIDTLIAGDRIGVQLSTNGSFAPTTLDVDAWLEIQKS